MKPAAALLVILWAGLLTAAPMTRLERQRLVSHLEMSESWLADELSGLTPAQLNFRPAPGTWNILDNLDHLVVCEPIYWQDLQKGLKTPLGDRRLNDRDDSVLWYGIDRTGRAPAVTAELPSGKLKDFETGLAAFRKLRAKMLEYARTTNDDLRGSFVEREQSDAYQWLLLISTHCQRHILQIREVKSDPRFPKK